MPKYLFFLLMSLMAILCLVIFKRLRQGEQATEPVTAQAETGGAER
jgi:hypothetical protein